MLFKEEIRRVLAEQQEEVEKFNQKIWVDRDKLDEARSALKRSWIKVITGIRRCGKSVLAHQMLRDSEYCYINFDDERLMGITAKDLNLLLQYLLEIKTGVKTLFFDEIQNVEGWELFVNRLHRQDYQIVITGSNSKLLSKELASHLTGRYISIHLAPFSWKEFLKTRKFDFELNSDFLTTEQKARVMQALSEYMELGGFPEMVMSGYSSEYLRELYDKIISRDITQRYAIKYTKTLKELALYGFSNLGCRMTYQKSKNIFNLSSVHTVKNYFQYLEDVYLLTLLQPFSFKYKEQIKQPRKLYTIDNGLSRAMSLKWIDNGGPAFENLVFQELSRRSLDCTYIAGLDYEVDFVIKQGREVYELIQASVSLENPDTKTHEVKALIKGATQTRCKNLKIITWDESGIEEYDGFQIQVIPFWRWAIS